LSRKRIDLRVMLGVYVVMGVGIFVAFMTLIVEILWVNKRQKNTTVQVQPRIELYD